MSQVEEAPSAASAFRHEALFYAGEDEFLAGTVPFIVDGVERDEPVLVVVNAPKIAALRHALNGAAHDVRFADMAEIGRNPARIIPAWREFVNAERRRGPPASGGRRADLLGSQRGGADGVPSPRVAAQSRVRGQWRLVAAVPVRHRQPSRRRRGRGTPHASVRLRGGTAPDRVRAARDLTEVSAPFEDPLPDPPPGTPAFVVRCSAAFPRCACSSASSARRPGSTRHASPISSWPPTKWQATASATAAARASCGSGSIRKQSSVTSVMRAGSTTRWSDGGVRRPNSRWARDVARQPVVRAASRFGRRRRARSFACTSNAG